MIICKNIEGPEKLGTGQAELQSQDDDSQFGVSAQDGFVPFGDKLY